MKKIIFILLTLVSFEISGQVCGNGITGSTVAKSYGYKTCVDSVLGRSVLNTVKVGGATNDSIGLFGYGYKAKLSVLGGARIESTTGESLFLNSRQYTVSHSDTTLYGNNVIALQNTAKTTANKSAFPAAARFLDSTGAEIGAVGWQPSTGSGTYELQETVFLASSMPYKPGQVTGIAPKRLALCQEGLYLAGNQTRRRLEFNTDWTINFRDPLGVNFLSFTALGSSTAVKDWTFSDATTHNGAARFNARIGVGTAPASNTLQHSAGLITGNAFSYSQILDDTINSDVTTAAVYSNAIIKTEAGSFTVADAYGYRVDLGTIGAGSAITRAHAFYGNIAAGTGRYNLNCTGTAQNYMAGVLGIGTNAPAATLHLSKSESANAWTTNGIRVRAQAGTYTDLTSSGTVTNMTLDYYGVGTVNSTNVVTYTNGFGATFEAPIGTGNATIQNGHSARFLAMVRMEGNLNFTGARVIGSVDNNSFSIRTNAAVRMIIANTGLIGIGPTAPTPTAHLHVAANTASNSSFRIEESATDPSSPNAGDVWNNAGLIKQRTGGVTYTIAKTLTNTATLDFDLTSVNYEDLTITVTGAADGDAASIGIPSTSVTANVQFEFMGCTTNTVTIRASRIDVASGADPGSGTFRASVIKY